MTTALVIVLAVMATALLVFQGYTFVWQLRLPGGVPRSVMALKLLNIGLLLAGIAVVVFVLVKG